MRIFIIPAIALLRKERYPLAFTTLRII